jgi:hypothetical protein
MVWFFWLIGGFVLFKNKEKIPIPSIYKLSVTGQDNTLKNEYIENHDKLSGCDMRFPGKPDTDEELILTIKKNMDRLDLLKILENPGIGIRFKHVQLEQYELLHGEGNTMKPNITAGGLFNDFNYRFDI